ncbi:cyanoexosortase A system-associated protein [Cylindrospermum sp. FACHB-282]|uniref:cyanoexosortase A system-associated protein n=1 Tax=Cylindrospermum sp. FACHB-282 TaxID=2692794 RepID=UPI00168848FD|nr:cyanoexosortase A system-associated protein [Cylindrospermum sp. FACHB-282]MBD2388527.1 cyanoexosortase A system-associated protein [Cylindrospermum sp. FACHB-282]
MTAWKQVRIPLLALTFVTGLLFVGKVTLQPNLENPKIKAFVFPEEVPLAQWQPSLTDPLKTPTLDPPELLSQKHYRYIDNNLSLDIEMRYLHNLSNADISLLIQRYTSIKSSAIMRQQEGIGYYGLGVNQQQAYLSACINPRGGSTFTHSQFRNNRYLKDVRFGRILPVLQGQEALIDKRCLWVFMSIPLRDSSPEAAYQILEKIWIPWYNWWQPRFPKP